MYVIEFRNGRFFVSSEADQPGTLQQAKRFSSEKEATLYAETRVPWVWVYGALVCKVEA